MEWPDAETLERAAAFAPDSIEVMCELEVVNPNTGESSEQRSPSESAPTDCSGGV